MERDLVEYIAKSLVDDPASVSIAVVEGDKSTVLELRVAPDDIGKVIGKHGRIAKAIRTILSASSAILEGEESSPQYPGVTGTPAAVMIPFAAALLPMSRMAFSGGPTNATLALSHDAAKAGFSERKP